MVIRVRYRNGKALETCDSNSCGGERSYGVPDVYFDKPYVDENIVDEAKPETWGGTLITSKRQKASEMRRLGIFESGDRKHGSRNYEKKRRYFI